MAGWIVAAVVILIAIKLICNSHTKETSARPAETIQRTTPQRNRTVPLSQKDETGPMVYYANDRYGSTDREYRFNYKKVNGSWRAYILRMPSFGNRSADGYITHRLWDGSKPYVCWDRSVNSLSDMQTISRVWADNIQEYIATGKRFG